MPQVATAQVVLEPGRRLPEIIKPARDIMEREFSNISRFCMELSRGKYPIC
jgi:S-adenosylmethionine synthetase